MKNIIYKELKLCIHPLLMLFALCGALMLIPSYPYEVAFFFGLTSIQITFATALQNNDQLFTINLPVKREDVVKAKFFDVFFFQAVQFVACVIFALISVFVVGNKTNQAGITSNFTVFGIGLICYSVFNCIFMPKFFKTGAKWGVPYCVGIVGFVATWLFFEIIVNAVSSLYKIFGVLDLAFIGYRIIFFAVCVAVYVATLVIAFNVSKKNYEKVSL